MKQPHIRDVSRFLYESNCIEQEYSSGALNDAEDAWDFAFNEANEPNFTFDNSFILHTHDVLLRNLNQEIAGKIRGVNVMVGTRLCIPPQLIHGQLSELWEDLNTQSDHILEFPHEEAAKKHIQFEKIHPFEDGNGRVGRILYNIHRLKLGLNINIIKESEKELYYSWFN